MITAVVIYTAAVIAWVVWCHLRPVTTRVIIIEGEDMSEQIDWKRHSQPSAAINEWLAWIVAGTTSGFLPILTESD